MSGTKTKKSDHFESDEELFEWLKSIEEDLKKDYKKYIEGDWMPKEKMGTAKLITQCGSERQAPADLTKNTVIASITDGSNVIGTRTFQKDTSRHGEYREVFTEYNDEYLKKIGKTASKKVAKAERPVFVWKSNDKTEVINYDGSNWFLEVIGHEVYIIKNDHNVYQENRRGKVNCRKFIEDKWFEKFYKEPEKTEEVKTPSTVRNLSELVKGLSLQELIDLKLKDMKFGKQ